MKCPKCGFENIEEAVFCNKCGSKLEVQCQECGQKNPAGSLFCNKCGHDLKAASEVTVDYSLPQSYTPRFLADKILTTRSSIEGERKLVTVFFADVAGYTPMTEKLDPEEVHGIMDGAFKILMDEIHRFEGTINQFTGDGVMALFGAPLAHEDHAQRACHAALSVQNTLGEYGEKVKADTGLEFKMRIGLNSGHVIVGSIGDDLRMDYTAVGDTTNLADRMQGLAAPGSVMVSAHTHRLATDFFEFESLGKLEIKGKKEKQEAYELIKTGEIATRIGASVSKGLTRFVGRKISMAALKEPYERVLEGSGQVVGVVGEAGVGKSRLLLEFVNQIPFGEFSYLQGRCLHYGGSMAYLPINDILKSWFEIKEGDREYLIKKKIGDKILGLDQNLEHTLPCFQEILSLKVEETSYLEQDAQMKKILTFEALRDLFIRISQDQPLVLAIEDLHWIDNTTQEFINYLIDWVPGSRILLILLYRPEYTHQWGSKSYYAKIGLDQLNPVSSKELIKAMLEGGEVALELRDLILDRSSGNPLFMEEFTQTLLENSSIQKQENQYVLDQDIKDIEVPDTIQGIISARMDRLEDNLKRTMQVASVIGRDFAIRILQSITGMREELKSYLLNLQGLEFIYEKQLFPELEYIFKHALIQEVAYNSLLQARRKEIHENIGNAIEEIYIDRLEEFYEVLAYHYYRSNNLEKAVEYGEKAANQAKDIFAHEDAVKLFEQTIEVQENLDSENKKKICELKLGFCDALITAGNPRRVLDQEAPLTLSIAESIGDNKLASKTCQLSFWALLYDSWGGAFFAPEAPKWAKLADLYAEPDTIERVWADAFRGMIKFFAGNSDEGLPLVQGAYKLARRLGDPETFWLAAGFFLYIGFAPKYQEEQLRLAEEMIETSRSGVTIRTLFETLAYISAILGIYGKREPGLNVRSERIHLAERTDQPHHQLNMAGADIVDSFWNGQLEKAGEAGTRLFEKGNELNLARYTWTLLYMHLQRAILYMTGSGAFIEALAQNPETSMGLLCMAHLGRDEEVIKKMNQYTSNPKYRDENFDFIPMNDIPLLETAVKVKDSKAVELFLHRLKNSKIITTGPWQPTYVHRHTGDGWEFLGNPEKAKADYNEALKQASKDQFRPEVALIRFQLAKLLFKHYPEEADEAMAHLDFAAAEFEEMKMKPSLEEALKLKETQGAG